MHPIHAPQPYTGKRSKFTACVQHQSGLPQTSPKHSKRVTPKGPQRHCQNQRRTMPPRYHGGTTHGEGLRGGWCACGVGWISTTTGPIPTVPFGGANVGLGRETAGPNRGVARSKAFKQFFSCIEKSPIPFQQVNGIALIKGVCSDFHNPGTFIKSHVARDGCFGCL